VPNLENPAPDVATSRDGGRLQPKPEALPSGPAAERSPMGYGWVFYVLAMVSIALVPILCTDFDTARILRNGTPAKARVTNIAPTGNYHNEQPEVVISLEVSLEGEAPFQSKVETYMSPVYLPRYQPGSIVDVRYDPKRRTDVALVPP
jgi:hypothetical protein